LRITVFLRMMKPNNIGGQAVIEGVMMKAERGWSVAVRDPKGEIHVKNKPLRTLPKIFKVPFVRGVLQLFHALFIGIEALEFSATKAAEEDEEELSKGAIAVTIGVSIGLGIGLFILLPLYATKLLGYVMPVVDTSSIAFNLVDGVIRVAIFLLYVILIGLWSEIARVFEYHGAEHKVIHAYEHQTPMEPADIMQYSPVHARCGTSFLMIVMIMSIIIFSSIPQVWPFWAKFLARVVLMPVIAGVSYEALKFTDKWKGNAIVHALMSPGLALQKLTTREPTEAQIEVALRAFNEALAMDAQEKENAG
jgi:uncharacterized protein YqhQ